MSAFGRLGSGIVESFCLHCGLVQNGTLHYRCCPVCRRMYLEAAIVHCVADCGVSRHLRVWDHQCASARVGFAGVRPGCALASLRSVLVGSRSDPDGRSCR